METSDIGKVEGAGKSRISVRTAARENGCPGIESLRLEEMPAIKDCQGDILWLIAKDPPSQ